MKASQSGQRIFLSNSSQKYSAIHEYFLHLGRLNYTTMKYLHSAIQLIAIAIAIAFTSCSEDDVKPGFSFSITEDIVLASEAGSLSTISFTSELNWQAEVSADWLTISATEGTAGTNAITIMALTENDSDESRIASLILTSEGLSRTITIRQETSDYVHLTQNVYQIDSEGGELNIEFSTSISADKLMIIGNSSWINQDSDSRALTQYTLTLNVDPNPAVQSRVCSLYFVKEESRQQIILATVTIIQEGSTGSESTDYSEDGKVKTLQSATIGNGIPIVLMGDGFIDAEISNGTYDQTMEKAYENLFTEEPFTSLKEYFDVYTVTAVSKNNIFGSGYETAFGCSLEGGGSTLITGESFAVISYTHCVKDIDYDKVLAVVILNTNQYAGTTYYGFTNPDMTDFAIAYCPVIDSLESEHFREVLVHEAVGHGFAKLEDEYAYSNSIPKAEKEQIQNLQSQYGWAQNVDFTDDRSEVLWHQFLENENYGDEGLGIFEGACTYAYGAYRPTENSMMNENNAGFNAPSRKAIYDRVMKDGTDTSPDFNTFVTFDLQTKQSRQRAVSSRTISGGKPFARPRFVGQPLSAK